MLTFKEAYYMGKHRSAAWHADGGANDEGWGNHNSQRHERQPDHPHSVHINGKKWKTFGSHSHASNVARKIKGATVHREEVEINELSSELLARYKEKAGVAATAADKAKKYDLGHKRFKGIIKATFKQFANDAKK